MGLWQEVVTLGYFSMLPRSAMNPHPLSEFLPLSGPLVAALRHIVHSVHVQCSLSAWKKWPGQSSSPTFSVYKSPASPAKILVG